MHISIMTKFSMKSHQMEIKKLKIQKCKIELYSIYVYTLLRTVILYREKLNQSVLSIVFVFILCCMYCRKRNQNKKRRLFELSQLHLLQKFLHFCFHSRAQFIVQLHDIFCSFSYIYIYIYIYI